MSKRKTKKGTINHKSLNDVIKASHRGSREAELDLLGPGFHSTTRVHTSKKVYSRKDKHRNFYETNF